MGSLKKKLKLRLASPKISCLSREFGDWPFSLLDMWAGNHSALRFSVIPYGHFDAILNCQACGNR
jgi:hypothetical protein